MFRKFPILFLLAAVLWPMQASSSSLKDGETYDEGSHTEFHAIGFSEDKKIFVFEEYGDIGEIGPFSKIYFLDTEKNTLVPNTTVDVNSDKGELPSIFQARLEAWKKAAPLIQKYATDGADAQLIAYNPFTEFDDKSNILRFRMRGHFDKLAEIQLKTKKFPAVADCPAPPLGISLKMTSPAEKMIFEDKDLPESRNCVLRYELIAVVGNFSGSPMIAMIKGTNDWHYESWIAVPFAAIEEDQ